MDDSGLVVFFQSFSEEDRELQVSGLDCLKRIREGGDVDTICRANIMASVYILRDHLGFEPTIERLLKLANHLRQDSTNQS